MPHNYPAFYCQYLSLPTYPTYCQYTQLPTCPLLSLCPITIIPHLLSTCPITNMPLLSICPITNLRHTVNMSHYQPVPVSSLSITNLSLLPATPLPTCPCCQPLHYQPAPVASHSITNLSLLPATPLHTTYVTLCVLWQATELCCSQPTARHYHIPNSWCEQLNRPLQLTLILSKAGYT